MQKKIGSQILSKIKPQMPDFKKNKIQIKSSNVPKMEIKKIETPVIVPEKMPGIKKISDVKPKLQPLLSLCPYRMESAVEIKGYTTQWAFKYGIQEIIGSYPKEGDSHHSFHTSAKDPNFPSRNIRNTHFFLTKEEAIKSYLNYLKKEIPAHEKSLAQFKVLYNQYLNY